MPSSSCTASDGRLSVHAQEGSAALVPLGLSVLRVTTTRVAGRAVPDPLPPLARRSTVGGSGPVRLILRFRVPEGTAAGTHDGGLVFSLDGRPFATLPVRLRVFGVQLPARDDPAGFRTLFLIQPQTYVQAVADRSGVASRSAGAGITDRLFAFLSDYRLSPGDWGSGTPWPDGYSDRPGWSAAAATRMSVEGAFPFRTMRLPLGTQRSAASRTGQSARAPQAWTAYLTRARAPVLAGARLARSCARVGLGRARADLRPPVRGTAGVRGARRGRDLPHDRRAGPPLRRTPRHDPLGRGARAASGSVRTARTTASSGTAEAATTSTSGRCSRGASTAPSRRRWSRPRTSTCSAS